jgi:Amino acid transporters
MAKIDAKKLGLMSLILMIFTSVYGFNNIPRAFYKMGYASIPWFILAGITFFVPYAFMVAEYGSAFKKETGGIYSWMEKSVGPKYAFIGTFMWYTSYVIWMVNVGSGLWVPVSNALFGADTTQSWHLLGIQFLSGPRALGVLGVLFIILVTFTCTKGLDKIKKVTSIGGTAVVLTNIIVLVGSIVIVIGNHGQFAEPFHGISSLTHSTNPDYAGNPILMLAFIVYALFAYGGLEAVGGLVDKTENPNKTFPKGVLIAAGVVVVGYSLLILLVGSFTNWHDVMANPMVNLGNCSYIVMTNFGVGLGKVFGATAATQLMLGHLVARLYGLAMSLALFGAFFTLTYSPLKQIIDGTPDQLWPGKMGKVREEDGMPVNAMWVQCVVVCIMIFLVAFGGNSMAKFFLILTAMVNVGMTIPYMFISGAFPRFKNLDNLDRPFQMFKSKTSTMVWSVIVTAMLGFANLFAIIEPWIDGDKITTIWSIAGPVLFGVVAMLMYKRYEGIVAKNGGENNDTNGEDNKDKIA